MKIKILARRGWGERAIARQTGISRNTVRRNLRAITQLWAPGVLKKFPGGGRSTSYELAD